MDTSLRESVGERDALASAERVLSARTVFTDPIEDREGKLTSFNLLELPSRIGTRVHVWTPGDIVHADWTREKAIHVAFSALRSLVRRSMPARPNALALSLVIGERAALEKDVELGELCSDTAHEQAVRYFDDGQPGLCSVCSAVGTACYYGPKKSWELIVPRVTRAIEQAGHLLGDESRARKERVLMAWRLAEALGIDLPST
jgi:hypothetical protein